jgi:hypothetical protein
MLNVADPDRLDRAKNARALAELHADEDDGLVAAYLLDAGAEARTLTPDDPFVRLLEVTESTVPVGISPLAFGAWVDPTDGTFWPALSLIQITPEEWNALKAGELQLPNGITVGAQVFAKHTEAGSLK